MPERQPLGHIKGILGWHGVGIRKAVHVNDSQRVLVQEDAFGDQGVREESKRRCVVLFALRENDLRPESAGTKFFPSKIRVGARKVALYAHVTQKHAPACVEVVLGRRIPVMDL